MRVLVLGGGGREHALCWRLAQAPSVDSLFCAPGNPGIFSGGCRPAMDSKGSAPLQADRVAELVAFAQREQIDLTIVGPELPLSVGVVDAFRVQGLTIFGPTRAAAQLETSKAFAKEILQAAGVSTARAVVVENASAALAAVATFDFPVVLKADGLASGKGVFICTTHDEASAAIERIFSHLGHSRVVVEEFLTGTEVSFIVATDGERIVPFPLAHDYKRLAEGDQGPNTGGMGAVSPTPRIEESRRDELARMIVIPVLEEMRKRGIPFTGFLYAGLMIRPDGRPAVLEFNTRLGDPECQVLMRRIDGDLAATLHDLALPRTPRGSSYQIDNATLKESRDFAVCAVLAADGYPDSPRAGDLIEGVSFAESIPGAVVFHAGTAQDGARRLITSGGRVLSVTIRAPELAGARAALYRAADMIQFRGRVMRRDLARDES